MAGTKKGSSAISTGESEGVVSTPRWFYEALRRTVGDFDLDAAALPENAKCGVYITPEQNALVSPWHGRVFLNPPYSKGKIDDFLLAARKRVCVQLADQVNEGICAELIAVLLPAKPPEAWWQCHVLGNPPTTLGSVTGYQLPLPVEVRYVAPRLSFTGPTPSWGSAVVIYRPGHMGTTSHVAWEVRKPKGASL